jgi:hypothetical protein
MYVIMTLKVMIANKNNAPREQWFAITTLKFQWFEEGV